MPAYVSIRQHTSAYVSVSTHLFRLAPCQPQPSPRAMTNRCASRPLCGPLHASVFVHFCTGRASKPSTFCTSKASKLSSFVLHSARLFGHLLLQHTSAYVSIRQHTSVYLCAPFRASLWTPSPSPLSFAVSAPAYVLIRQHTSAYVIIRSERTCIRQHTSAYVIIRYHSI